VSAVCPAGHTSSADDYCDVCGMPIDASAVTPEAPPPPIDVPAQAEAPPAQSSGQQPCPNCSTLNAPEALFCENCGYDFITGAMPRPQPAPEGQPSPATPATPGPAYAAADGAVSAGAFDWVAEVWIDPAWYEAQESPDPMPSPGLPEVVPLRGSSLLVGRTSRSRNIHPQIACEADSGVSRRQAQLTTDGHRWWVEDLESANGTFVAPASSALPEDPIPVGVKRELAADDRVYLGAWTRLVIRPATDEERATLG
jgi:hypothetical protein